MATDTIDPQQEGKMDTDAQELSTYLEILGIDEQGSSSRATWVDEVKTTPLFTWPVRSLAEMPLSSQPAPPLIDAGDEDAPKSLVDNLQSDQSPPPHIGSDKKNAPEKPCFQQYSVLGHELTSAHRPSRPLGDRAVFLNTDAPWSAFLCGLQGSGKSHTLSCMLENCLLESPSLGKTPKPLAGVIFAYDAQSAAIACEAAFLGSQIPVRVLVSPSNYYDMKSAYEQLPGTMNIKVYPLFLKEKHLSTQRMLRLMAFSEGSGSVPLYMEVIIGILKSMRLSLGSAKGAKFNYKQFLRNLEASGLAGAQKGPMNLRLQMLHDFMDSGDLAEKLPANEKAGDLDVFKPEAGTLTIVDLTDPCVDAAGACVLFDICLSLFLEDRSGTPKIIALDEAHKLMTETAASQQLTDNLLTVIREQRHKGVRIVIATQEPTISPKLLDLCSMTFVHRFTSPEWFHTLRQHLAGASDLIQSDADQRSQNAQQLFHDIATLNVGESMLFSPSAMLDIVDGKPQKLGVGHLKFKTRMRLTADGGKSVTAT